MKAKTSVVKRGIHISDKMCDCGTLIHLKQFIISHCGILKLTTFHLSPKDLNFIF